MKNKKSNVFIIAITIATLCIALFSVLYLTINSITFVTATTNLENVELFRNSGSLHLSSPLGRDDGPTGEGGRAQSDPARPDSEVTTSEEGRNSDDGPTGQLGHDLYSFNFELNNVVYTFPLPFETLESIGWRVFLGFGPRADEVLEPNHSRVAVIALGDSDFWSVIAFDQSFSVALGNLTDSPIYARDSYITYISYGISNAEEGVRLILPGDITVGSTYDEVIEAHGRPDEIIIHYDTNTMELIYDSDPTPLNREIVIKIDLETNQVYSITIIAKVAFDNWRD